MNDENGGKTEQSWFGRLGSSIKGVIVGIVLAAAAAGFVYWNEGQVAKKAGALAEAARVIVKADVDQPAAKNEGKLVYLTGRLEPATPVADETFGVRAEGIKLKRTVRMYQWKEVKSSEKINKSDGSTETVTRYRYEKTWSEDLIDSSRFHKAGHPQNPSEMPYQTTEFTSREVKLGGYILANELVRGISGYQPHPVTTRPWNLTLSKPITPAESGFYVGYSSMNPNVGDLKITFEIVPPKTVSVAAKQENGRLVSYMTRSGKPIAMVYPGQKTPAQMFEQAKKSSQTTAWIIRVIAFLILALGISLIIKPVTVILGIIPVFGQVANFILGLASLAAAGAVIYAIMMTLQTI